MGNEYPGPQPHIYPAYIYSCIAKLAVFDKNRLTIKQKKAIEKVYNLLLTKFHVAASRNPSKVPESIKEIPGVEVVKFEFGNSKENLKVFITGQEVKNLDLRHI